MTLSDIGLPAKLTSRTAIHFCILRVLLIHVWRRAALEVPRRVIVSAFLGCRMSQENTTVIRKTITMIPAEAEKSFQFRNYYHCPNEGTKWRDEWNHLCNDRCPVCDSEIEPYFSEDVVNY